MKRWLIFCVLSTFFLPQIAFGARPFAEAYSNVTQGAFSRAANGVMTCDRTRESSSRCDSIQSTNGAISFSNNTTYTRWIDVDGFVDADLDGLDDTYNSSSADLSVPATGRVVWGGLYWQGNTQNSGSRTNVATGSTNTVEVRLANSTSYLTVTADWCDTIGSRYACYADVSDLLPAAPTGTYTVANVFAHTGQDDYVGGWELLVAYEDESLPLRSLSVFHGHESYGGGSSQTFVISDFLTPLMGPIEAEIGVMIAEGDANASDNLDFQSEFAATATTVTNDLGDGSIEAFGSNVTTRSPAYRNLLGHDSDTFDVGAEMVNGAREATITLPGSGGETNELIKVDFAVDVYFPDVSATKTVTDLDGGDVVVGDTLRYTLRVENSATADDGAVSVVLTDELSPLLDFVPGSIAVTQTPTSGPAVGPKTDQPGDDVATWDSAMRTLTVNVGRNASSTSGGELSPGESMEFTFDAVVLPSSANQLVSNTATVTYQGATLAGANRLRIATTSSDDPTTPGGGPTDVTPGEDPDGDGLSEGDNDEDNDGIPDATEGFGVDPSADSDGDGIDDWADSDAPGFVDADGNGVDDRYDLDGDGIPNHRDLDSDGDGLSDIFETSGAALDTDSDGVIDSMIDADQDGILDVVDQDQGGTPLTIPNTDGTGLTDPYDPDDDDDGIPTSVEVSDSTAFGADIDGDGLPAWRDTDSDGDGIDDALETADIDVDGVPDYLDPDQGFLTAPAQGERSRSGDVTVTGQTEPGASVAIEIVSDGGASAASQTVTADGSGGFSQTFTGLADGDYTVSATATDATGASFTDSVDISVASVFVTFDEPVDGALTNDATPTLAGRSDPGTAVTIVIDEGTASEVTLNTTTNGAGDWFLFAPPLSDGLHIAVARADDGAGNTAEDSVQFTVDASPPVVSVDAPADGSTISDNTPSIDGTASAGESVDVSIDGTRVTTVTADANGDWNYQVGIALADSVHLVEARVRDAAGNESTATSQFTVDTSAPAVAISTPRDGATVGSAEPTVSGTTEPGADVTITIDGTVVATVTADSNGNWSYASMTLADGMHTVTASASDAAGNVSDDATVSFTVDTTLPFVQISEPQNGTTTSNATPTVVGRADPNAFIQIEVDGSFVGSAAADTNGDWRFTVPNALVEGSHVVQATANDGVNVATDSVAFSVDLTAPVLTIDTPSNGDTTGSTPTITGTSEPGATVVVTLPDGTEVTTTADMNGDWSVTTAVIPEGPARILVTASDDAGNETPRTVDVVVDVTDPLLEITNPDDNTTKSDPLLTFEGTTDEPNAEVVLVLDSVEISRTMSDAFGDWSYTPTTPLSDGPHTLRAFVEDDAGNRGEDTVDFIVDTRAPIVSIATPTEGEEVTTARPVISGKAEAGIVVEIFIDGTKVADATADANGDWSYTPGSDLADGDHTIRAEATDAAGNTGSDESNFTVDTVAPFVTVQVPADGSVISAATVAVAGRTKPGETVEVILDGTRVGESVAGPSGDWTFVVIGLSEGEHTVEGRVTGASDSSTFTVDRSAPAVSIDSPDDGDLINDSTPEISGAAEPNSTVEIFVDGQKVAEVTTDANGDWSYSSDELDDGEHTVEARSTDAAGNEGTSGTVTFTLDTTPPDLAVDSPTDGESVTGATTVSGTAEPGAVVEVFVDGEKVGEATADEDGGWSVDLGDLGEGEHTIDVVARDEAGNEAEVGPIEISVESGSNNGNNGTGNNGTGNNGNNGTGNNATGPNGSDDDAFNDSYLAGGCVQAAQSSGLSGSLPGGIVLVLIALVGSRLRRRRS